MIIVYVQIHLFIDLYIYILIYVYSFWWHLTDGEFGFCRGATKKKWNLHLTEVENSPPSLWNFSFHQKKGHQFDGKQMNST